MISGYSEKQEKCVESVYNLYKVCCFSVFTNLNTKCFCAEFDCICVNVCTWLKEKLADHSKTCRCLRGSVVAPVFYSLYLTLRRAGTSVSVAHVLTQGQLSFFQFTFFLVFINSTIAIK